MPVAATTFGLTNFNTAAGATQYKAAIDADFSVLTRLGDCFAPHQGSTADLRVYLDPGFILSGTSLTELGTYTTATFGNASTSATVASATGISGTMWITGAGIPNGTTCTISGTTLTLSQATTAAGTAAPVVLGQRTSAIVAPVTNPRIDRIVVSASTGAVSIIAGAENASPTPPAFTAGVLPVAQVLMQTSSTAILNTMLTDERALGGGAGVNNTEATVASAGTTDLGATNVNAQLITGTTTITSFGSNGNLTNPFYRVRWNNALTLTHNGTSLILPGANNIVTINGDSALFQYLGSGNWKCIEYNRFSGAQVNMGLAATIASATTTDLGTKGVNILTISGVTTITAFGSTATTDNPLYFITFSGSLTLTNNNTSLILPGSANIVTQTNDACIAQYLGSGNWQVLAYWPATGSASETVGYNAQTTTYAPVGSDRGKIVDFTGSSNATWTMTSAATLGAGWFCYLRNNGTSNAQLTLKSSSGTIDTIAAASGYIMYAGEVRLITSDGTNFQTIVQNGGSAVFTSSTTWMRPPGYTAFALDILSGGGAGASRTTTGNSGGGAGGAHLGTIIAASSFVAIASTETVTIGGTAAGVTGNTAGTNGNDSSMTVNGTTLTINGSVGGATAAASAVVEPALTGGPSYYKTFQASVISAGVGGANAGGFWCTTQLTTGLLASNFPLLEASLGGNVTAANVPAVGGNSINGGGGGGGCSSTAGGTRTGGTSVMGGAGGAGGANTGGNATNGTAPAGGGGGACNGGTSGSGARGEIKIRGIL